MLKLLLCLSFCVLMSSCQHPSNGQWQGFIELQTVRPVQLKDSMDRFFNLEHGPAQIRINTYYNPYIARIFHRVQILDSQSQRHSVYFYGLTPVGQNQFMTQSRQSGQPYDILAQQIEEVEHVSPKQQISYSTRCSGPERRSVVDEIQTKYFQLSFVHPKDEKVMAIFKSKPEVKKVKDKVLDSECV